LLGEAFIEMTPGAAHAPPIPDGGSLPSSDVQTAQRLDDVLETFRPSTRRDFRRLFAGLAAAFHGRGRALNDSLAHMEPFTGNLGEVLDTLDAQRRDIRSVVARSGDIFTALGSREGVLQAAITAGNEVFGATARRNRELAATIHALPPFLRQVRRTSRTVSAASGDLAGAIGPLRSVARELPGALRETERSAPEFRELFHELPRTLKAANTGLPAATRMFRASSPALRDIYPTTREFLPFLQLLGLSRRPLVGLFADVGSQSNGVSLGPGGQRIHTAGGAVTVWNESVGGWTRRLPTNRMNPYFKPGGTESEGGLLKAYDCRNTDNPEYLPPTGTGAPPCVLQGPWEFNGTRQYFPHLTLAPP
jgi:ABC-type transporter Mla subunit MlaD